MKLLNEYCEKRQEIFDYFGYVEDFRILPIDDATDYVWKLHQESSGSGYVFFADTVEDLEDEDAGNYYDNEIYTQRHLPKWVYRGKEYTMIVVDSRQDMNQFLQIFDNSKEIKE